MFTLSDEVKEKLMHEARDYAQVHFSTQHIHPCDGHLDFDSCFDFDDTENLIYFWFEIFTDGHNHSSVVYLKLD